jgi:UDP-3-O-[3-hydroxymyristoyl] glucosamine N-acyltransferase
MDLSLSLDEIRNIVKPQRTAGNYDGPIRAISGLAEARPGDLTFLANPKYRKQVATSQASLLLLPSDYDGEPRDGQVYFFQENATLALAQICQRLEQRLWPKPPAGIHPAAVVGENCRIAASATVGPLCVIEDGVEVGEGAVLQAHVFLGRGVKIGAECWLMANTTVQAHCQIGDRVRLHPGVVIGSDGFGYETTPQGRHEKLPQIGNVIIGHDVEIGANTTVDRARFEKTEIGEGTKIDNLVQIGHNVIIGRHCIIVSQVGIAGSTKLGDYVVIGGQAGLGGHIQIGSGCMIAARAGVAKDLEPKSYVGGAPALPIKLEHKLTALRKRLPDLFHEVDRLADEVKKLSNSA